MFNLLSNNKTHKEVISVLDRLLDFAVRDWSHKNIDSSLYKILNSPEVYQEAIHMGLYPIVAENKKASAEFLDFINNLWIYIEYDLNTDTLWAQTVNIPGSHDRIHEKISLVKKEILHYLLKKKLITDEQYSNELSRKIKKLTE